MIEFRKTTIEEAACLQQWHNAPSVYRWVPIDDWKVYYHAVAKLQNYYIYSVYLEGKLMAYIAAEILNGSAAICLVVNPENHGKGIGSAVLIEMLRQSTALFGKINSISAGIFPENKRSIRCFEKAGFQKTCKGNDGEDIYEYIIKE